MTDNEEYENVYPKEGTSEIGQAYPYLDNVKADPRLLGLGPIQNPFADKVSSQRAMMFGSHILQSVVLHGHEQPKVFTGFESIIGDYEHDITQCDQDRQILDIIPKYAKDNSLHSIEYNPSYTIIYQGMRDGIVSYFNLDKFTLRGKGWGYPNKWNPNIASILTPGTVLPKEVKLTTSPAHVGNQYQLGTNLKTCYMSLPGVTEDAFIISESAAKKLSSDGYGQIAIEINPDQLPLNLYGDEDEYKFMPDINETVRDDGVLMALRTPTSDSIVYDTSPNNLSTIQELHDDPFYIPQGSTIVDIDLIVNTRCEQKFSSRLYEQLEKYKSGNIAYANKIYSRYLAEIKQGKKISNSFSTLVTRAIETLLINGEYIEGFTRSKGTKISLVKKKKEIRFIYMVITYKYENHVKRGFKVAGRYGNKGVVTSIYPDEMMPVDEHGIRADIIVDGISVFNRMNPSQLYEQFINAGAEHVRMSMQSMVNADPVNGYKQAYTWMLEYLSDCNPNWATLVDSVHATDEDKKALVEETLKTGMIIQMSPFQKGFNQNNILPMRDKYGIYKTPVTYGVKLEDDSFKKVTSIKPVLIGDEYWFCLCKIPHMRSSGIGYVNQYHSPSRPSSFAKLQYPFAQTAIRVGEDEIRNITLVTGSDNASRVLGMYGNSPEVTSKLGEYLISTKSPSTLKKLDVATEEIRDSNVLLGVVKHCFSCVGIDVSGNINQLTPQQRKFLLRDDAVAAEDMAAYETESQSKSNEEED